MIKTVAVLFGGRSAEHDVSIVTALASVIKPLELTGKYRVEAVYIAKDGAWYWGDEFKDINLFTSGAIDDTLRKQKPASVKFDGGMTLSLPGLRKNKQCKIDVAFPAMHGTYGEDGSLMGLLRMANIPFVGCDLASSVLAMDKILAKLIVEARGIKTPKMEFSDKSKYLESPSDFVAKIEGKLEYPLFVKPAHLGSSIGISKANNKQELENALELAFHYDQVVLAEEGVNNLIEVTLPIIGNDKPRPALLEQPLVSAEDFFDFETKYMQGGKKGKSAKAGGKLGAQGYSKLPADLPGDLYAKAEKVGLDVFVALGCSGIARVDMLIDKEEQKVYFNEVNPMPGDLYAHNWRAAGVSNVELVEELVGLAEDYWQKQQNQATAFQTNYLKQF